MSYRFVILGSGTGSNAEALLRAWQARELGPAEPVALYSDQADSRFLTLGEFYGVPAHFIDPGPKRTVLTPEAEGRWIEALRVVQPDLIVLAGFMRVLKPPFLEAFPGRIINLHPSLLPSFPGLDAVGQALARGVKVTGCTVHRVTPEVDGGPILAQTAVRIEETDTKETLATRVHAAEHTLLCAVVRQLSEEVPA